MPTDNLIDLKTRELCETILAQPEFRTAQQRLQAFLADDQARNQYEAVASKGQALHEKQHRAEPLNNEEIAAFEKEREALLANPVARGFMDAQEELHDLQHSIQRQVKKTLELGRLPTPDELVEGSCGNGGCGCHGH
jgi:cell fate (sporulation/competence/biofilm development) regulator YlbF (YheA/YmcA/DUF963 family)